MSATDDLKKDLKRWKDKYFVQQERFEAQSQQDSSEKEVLQRLLMRICLSAEGQDSRLDLELQGLRQEIKAPRLTESKLTKRLSRIDKILLRLDESKARESKDFVKLLSDMITTLQSLQLPRLQQRPLKQLHERVVKNGENALQHLSLLAEFQTIQDAIINGMQQGQPEKPGLFERLFHTEKKPNESPEAPPLYVENDALELAVPSPEGEEIVPGYSAISVHIRGTLSHLLEQLTHPKSSEMALRDLRQKIDQHLNWYELGPTLDDVAAIVIASAGKGRREFGEFLVDIDTRLAQIQALVQTTLKADSRIQKQGVELEAAIQEQVQRLSSSLVESGDIESLKASVKGQVDLISTALDQFKDSGARLADARTEELDVMAARFKELEAETDFFRDRLQEEQQKALTDALTQLPNREAYNERFKLEWERWQRYQHKVSLVVVDVDHFKRINDRYGHLSGDKVLQILGKEIRQRVRKTDFVARFGCEEFVIILPETDLQVAHEVIDKMREMVAKLPFHFRAEELQVTVSCGLVEFSVADDPEAIFSAADQAMYQAKKLGRNRIHSTKSKG